MPLRPAVPCRHPGCGERTRTGYCLRHAAPPQVDDRSSARVRGYDGAWQRVAACRRQLDRWLCQRCLQFDRLTLASLVDHIVPLHVRPDWRLVLANTQVLCPACHQRKSADDARQYGSSAATSLSREQQQERDRAFEMESPPRTTA